MIRFMRNLWVAYLCLGCSTLLAANSLHRVELASSTAVLDEPLRAVLHLRPWNAAQLEYPLSCLQAELRYGELVIPAAQLQISVVPMPELGYVRVALFSPLVVSEPLVYLKLTLHCEPQFEQQWTLFAEPEDIPPVRKATMPELVWKDSVAGLLDSAPAATIGPAIAPAIAPTPVRSAPARKTRAQQNAAAPLSAASPAPQLRLDEADPSALAQLVRALWQQHSQDRFEALQHQLVTLQETNVQLQARAQALQHQVEQLQKPDLSSKPPASHWRASATWVLHDMLPWFAASVLVGVLAWFLRWLHAEREPRARHHAEEGSARLRRALKLRTPPRRPAPPHTASQTPPPPAASGAMATVEHTLPEEVQTQADEFIQAGHLGAVAMLLEAHLRSQAQKSAPVLLSLLDIYEELEQAQQVERVGNLLSELFNLRKPSSAQASEAGLEDHPDTMESIAEQWNQPSVREVLKNLMLRPTAIEELSLAAFRDVLALYEMASLRDTLSPPSTLEWE